VTEPVQADAALAAAHRTTDEALSPGDAVVRLVAHRGSGHAHTDPLGPPENTLSAVEYGFSQGADAVEVDVWRTADGIVVLHHDATTDRTTDQPGWDITGATYAQLLALSAGSWKQDSWAGLGIPTLADCARAVPQGRGLVVEIEEGPQVVADVLSAITPAGLTPEEIMFISKNLDTAGEVKRQAPNTGFCGSSTRPRGGRSGAGPRATGAVRTAHESVTTTRRTATGWCNRFSTAGSTGWTRCSPTRPICLWQCRRPGCSGWSGPPTTRAAMDICLQDGAWGITTDNTAQVRTWLEASGRSTAHAAAQHF
jgi:glycerophosphoryl diester phosphodiesterase